MFESDSDSETENRTASGKGEKGNGAIAVEEHQKEEEEKLLQDEGRFAGETQAVAGWQVQDTRQLAGEKKLLQENVGGFAGETQVVAGWPRQEETRENICGSILTTQDPSTQEFNLALQVSCLV